jgi:hypothetical protein
MKFTFTGIRVALTTMLAGAYAVIEARRDDSPGGKSIIAEEYLSIFAAVGNDVQGDKPVIDFQRFADKLHAAKADDSPGGVEFAPQEIVSLLAEAGHAWVTHEDAKPELAVDDLIDAFSAAGWDVIPSGWSDA